MLVEGIIYKICVSCKEQLPRGCFTKKDNYVGGWSHKCNKCLRSGKKKTGVYRDQDFANKQVNRYGYFKI